MALKFLSVFSRQISVADGENILANINVGIIGLGHMGRLHMMNCLHMEDVKVVAAADSSERELRKAKPLGVKNLYTDYLDLIDDSPELDAAIISLPNFLHFDGARSALESGVNVFVEKPMATTVEECKRIVKLVKRSDKKFMVGHSLRFVDAIEKMKDSLDKGYIGKLEIATMESIQNGPFSHGAVPRPVSEWWFDPKKAGGGVLLDLGYHLIDLFHFLVGESQVLFSYCDHKYNLPVEDGATVVLRSSQSDVRGVINVGWFEKTIFPKFNFRVILHGNADYISTEELIPRNPYTYAVKEGTKNLLRRMLGKRIQFLSYTYYYRSYYKELQHFFKCIRQDLDTSVSATDGLKTIEKIAEAYDSFGQEDN